MIELAVAFLAGVGAALIVRAAVSRKTLYGEFCLTIRTAKLRSWLAERQVSFDDPEWLTKGPQIITLRCRTLNGRLWGTDAYPLWWSAGAGAEVCVKQDRESNVSIMVVLDRECVSDRTTDSGRVSNRDIRTIVINKIPFGEISAYRRAVELDSGTYEFRAQLQERAKSAIEGMCVGPVRYLAGGLIGPIDFEELLRIEYTPILLCGLQPPGPTSREDSSE